MVSYPTGSICGAIAGAISSARVCRARFSERNFPELRSLKRALHDTFIGMPSYRRLYRPGGTFFFTLVTDGRLPLFDDSAARRLLRLAIAQARGSRPFNLDAIVLLPEHLHLMLTLSQNDTDYSTRIAHIKSLFTHSWLDSGHGEDSPSNYRQRTRRRGIWQPRFWEHLIRDQDDYNNHFDYICYNPVKHGHCTCPHQWHHSTFHNAVNNDLYPADWLCICEGRKVEPPNFRRLALSDIEFGE